MQDYGYEDILREVFGKSAVSSVHEEEPVFKKVDDEEIKKNVTSLISLRKPHKKDRLKNA